MLETETEYTLSKGRSCFIMQSHKGGIGADFIVVDSYIDRRLDESFKIRIDRAAGTSSIETL